MSAQHPDRLNFLSFLFVLTFAAAWWLADIYVATMVLMVLMTIQIVSMKLLARRLETLTVAMWLLVLILGTITLVLREKLFIQLKTTIVYSLFAAILLVSEFMLKKSLPRIAAHSFFNAPDKIWRRISVLLAVFFMGLAACNLLIVHYLSEAAWVSIKTFGFPLATFLFTVGLVVYLYPYAKMEGSSGERS